MKEEKDEYMELPSSEITAAERGGDNLNSNLHGLWRTHFHLLHHQWLSSSPCHRSLINECLLVLIIINYYNKKAEKKQKLKYLCM